MTREEFFQYTEQWLKRERDEYRHGVSNRKPTIPAEQNVAFYAVDMLLDAWREAGVQGKFPWEVEK